MASTIQLPKRFFESKSIRIRKTINILQNSDKGFDEINHQIAMILKNQIDIKIPENMLHLVNP